MHSQPSVGATAPTCVLETTQSVLQLVRSLRLGDIRRRDYNRFQNVDNELSRLPAAMPPSSQASRPPKKNLRHRHSRLSDLHVDDVCARLDTRSSRDVPS
eukprot:TRINITY_DN19034_c0_g1_i2.p1 TRINITY_DN19034_c0_g1~~TRINITY_DN19034_c0_g1_i2.p1  ORF type:complete len:100 (-),score=4.50 TRINITY_DN19034_c0_g1_i2:318-617(-)